MLYFFSFFFPRAKGPPKDPGARGGRVGVATAPEAVSNRRRGSGLLGVGLPSGANKRGIATSWEELALASEVALGATDVRSRRAALREMLKVMILLDFSIIMWYYISH